MEDDVLSDSLRGYKLCGFLRVVLSVDASMEQSMNIPFCTPCFLFTDGSNVGFRTEGGILLLPVPEPAAPRESEPTESPAGNGGSCSGGKRKRGRRGLTERTSVVHQLHMLTVRKCVKIQARVLKVFSRKCGDARALVFVDVYLPIEVWCGWQFPNSGAMAASLLKHVSCNWEARRLSHESNKDHSDAGDEAIWKIPHCHVLGCEVHCARTSHDNRLFDLHEIFKGLPGTGRDDRQLYTRIIPEKASDTLGISCLSNDMLYKILTLLCPEDLVRVAATCHHLRCLASTITPCMKLKLFPHQDAAVEWMLKRERKPDSISHPLCRRLSTVDNFLFYINVVSGEISTGAAPTISDFQGGMFCDEPGLGKTVTVLSLILKTYGTLADPPDGVDVKWCTHKSDQRCGYYELGSCTTTYLQSAWRRFMNQNGKNEEVCTDNLSSKIVSDLTTKRTMLKRGRAAAQSASVKKSCSSPSAQFTPLQCTVSSTRSLNNLSRDLFGLYDRTVDRELNKNTSDNLISCCNLSNDTRIPSSTGQDALLKSSSNRKRKKSSVPGSHETWVQCDACRKWRKLADDQNFDSTAVWFCSMNNDATHKSCSAPEETWDCKKKITYLPGFYTKGSKPGTEENVSFFTGVLNDHLMLLVVKTKKALTWLANLSEVELLKMETLGITCPSLDFSTIYGKQCYSYHEIFQAFGLVGKPLRIQTRWYSPGTLENLIFDSTALKIALTKPLDLCRLYLSGATLVVVPANLVEHWTTQIEKHILPGQLRVYVWNENREPGAHNLAWDYDIVITTFNRFSAEWSPHKKSVLMQVHWLRIILDEGHTLGSSLYLTNKFQMSISLHASNRWILTGTPTPTTPNSQVSQLYPMLKFLHEEVYGQNYKSWEASC